MKKKLLHIAIDGQSASGKDTVGAILAKQLGCFFIESGAMYRAAAWLVREQQGDFSDSDQVYRIVSKANFEIRNTEKDDRIIPQVRVNGTDIEPFIRSKDIDRLSSLVASQPKVRKYLIRLKKQIARTHSRLIMTGRGIGRTVLPRADIKVYLTASLSERARRRAAQYQRMGKPVDIDAIAAELAERDAMNKNRSFDPDVPAEGSVSIDTTNLALVQVCQEINKQYQEMFE
ncbi:MAG TPA: (d)CMP kinase [bacterium]|nr:(d)CMP kinase [bacterium]